MKISLIVDHRENALITLLKQKSASTQVEMLDLGDILFKEGEDTVMIIERKTVADLKSSLCDGRLREQKARLLGCGLPVKRIMYIIEGNLDRELSDSEGGIPVSTLIGSIINTQLRDDIKVYKTASVAETANFIIRLHHKLNSDTSNPVFFNTCTQKPYAATLKKKKKENMTPELWLVAQLSLIPQVSDTTAAAIVAKYPTLPALISSSISDIANITYLTQTEKQRRVGEKLAAKIFTYLNGENTDSNKKEGDE